jgi:hypothetical protein
VTGVTNSLTATQTGTGNTFTSTQR